MKKKAELIRFAMAFILICMAMTEAKAIPAYPGLIKAKQANGTVITIRKVGDEYCHMTVSRDGYPLMFNAKTRNFEYATLQGSSLVATGIVAAEPKARTATDRTLLAKVDKKAVMSQFDADFAKARAKATENYNTSKNGKGIKKIVRISDVPTTGKHDVAVILVNFADRKFSTMSDPAAYYDEFFHEKGFSRNGAQGSVYDYYRNGSNEKYDPQFKVYGPVTVSMGYSSYSGSGGTTDTWKMVKEAVQLVDSIYGVDFKQFDTDNDGVCDNIYCIYAGYGQADSHYNDAIWPHSGHLSRSGNSMISDNSFSVKGTKIDRYTVSQEINGQTEKTCGIGTFVHEFAHVLGLADHYNNNSSYASNQLGYWDVMASGSYNNYQNTPPTFSAFERYSLGWQNLPELAAKTDSMVTVSPLEDGGTAYRVSVPDRSNEYFIIENRQKKGWDKFLPGHGMLVWHIDEDAEIWRRNMANYNASHQHVDIVEANGTGSTNGKDSDPFPGSANITSYTFPSWQDGDIFGFGWLRENEDSTVQFILSGSKYKLEKPSLTVSNVRGTSATLSWSASQLATGYKVMVMQGDSIAAETTATEAGEQSFTGLQPETDYTAVVLATLAEYSSDSIKVPFTTLKKQIEETKVQALEPVDVKQNSFTARWESVDDANRYQVVLYSKGHDGVGKYGTGFDDYSSTSPVLPEGWKDPENHSSNKLYYGTEAPSLRINNDSASLTVSKPGYKLQSIKFWHYASNTTASLVVEEAVNGTWTELRRYLFNRDTDSQPDLYPHGGRADSLQLNNADSVRFTLVRAEGQRGYILLDDVYASYGYDTYTPIDTAYVNADNNKETMTYTFSGLNTSTNYCYNVTALVGERTSITSDMISVTLTDEPTSINNTTQQDLQSSNGAAIYDLQGRRVSTVVNGQPAQSLMKGVYIIGNKKITIK